MAHITSDQWGVIVDAAAGMQPLVIRASERNAYTAEATWLPGDKLEKALETDSSLQKAVPDIRAAVSRFEECTEISHRDFTAPLLSDEQAHAVVYETIGDILKQDTLAAKLIRFALADENLKVYVIPAFRVHGHCFYDSGQACMKKKFGPVNGLCDDNPSHAAVYMGTIDEDGLPLKQSNSNGDGLRWLICEELLHHAMKRLYGNECEVYPFKGDFRQRMLDEVICMDALRAGGKVPENVIGDLKAAALLETADEPVQKRFRTDFDFSSIVYPKWDEIYVEFPVKALTRQALGMWDDPAHTPDRSFDGETFAWRYPNIGSHVATVIAEDLVHFEKTATLPQHPAVINANKLWCDGVRPGKPATQEKSAAQGRVPA